VKLQGKIFLGLAAGIVVGGMSKLPNLEPLRNAVIAIEPLGTVFIRLVTMTVVPLVVASLFLGVATLGDMRRLGRIGGRTLLYFLVTTLVAATIGLAAARFTRLGENASPDIRASMVNRSEQAGAVVVLPAVRAPGLVQTFVDMTPQNPFAAAAQGDLLPLIIAVCIFAAAATAASGAGTRTVVRFFEGVNELSMIVIGWLMWLAPYAVFVLIAATVAKSGLEFLASLAAYSLVVVVAMAVHVAVVLLPILRLGGHLGVVPFFRAVSDALLLAFSTASSSVTLPVSIAAAKNRLGISNEVASFVLPAGVTLNKNGAAVYKAVTAVFLAHLYGMDIGMAQSVTIILTTVMASAAGAGVPGSSLVTTLIVLNALGLGPQAAAGIALVVAVDRPLDMCRSTVNTIGNLVGAALVSRSEGQAPRIVTSAGG
jgi:Na+/H+-dicarboxylate symporter